MCVFMPFLLRSKELTLPEEKFVSCPALGRYLKAFITSFLEKVHLFTQEPRWIVYAAPVVCSGRRGIDLACPSKALDREISHAYVPDPGETWDIRTLVAFAAGQWCMLADTHHCGDRRVLPAQLHWERTSGSSFLVSICCPTSFFPLVSLVCKL